MSNKNENSSKIGNQQTDSQVNKIKGHPTPQVLPGGKVIADRVISSSVTGDVNPAQPFN